MPRYEDDDDDDRPRSRRRRDEDDRPRRRRDEDEDEDDDDRPQRHREDDDDEDDRPRSRSRRRDADEDDDRPRRRRKPEGNAPAATSLTLGLLSILLNVLTGIPAIIFGVVGLKKAGPYGPGRGMAWGGIGSAILGTLLSGVGYYFAWNAVSTNRTDNRVRNNAKQIGLGMHSHHDAFNGFPPAYTKQPGVIDRPDQPVPMEQRLTSWRTAILPFVEQEALFRQYDPEQPWDSPRNQQTTNVVVRSYLNDEAATNQTRFRVFTGRNTAFRHGTAAARIINFTDGTSNTLLFVESAESGPWGEPKDVELPPFGPLPPLGSPAKNTFLVLMADGSVRVVSKAISERTMRLVIDPADGNAVPGDF